MLTELDVVQLETTRAVLMLTTFDVMSFSGGKYLNLTYRELRMTTSIDGKAVSTKKTVMVSAPSLILLLLLSHAASSRPPDDV